MQIPNLVDTHAHIYADKFKEDLSAVLEKAEEAGVNKIYMPNIDHTSIDGMLEIEHKNPEKYLPMMGLHPCSVNKGFEKELYLVEDWLSKRKFAAVGEMGIDLYWDKTYFEQQKEAFKIQVEFAKKYSLPIVMHSRDAMDEIIELLQQLNDDNLTGVLHCFTGDLTQARKLIDMGFYLGIGGVSTFKNGGLDKVLPDLELKNLLLETDAPYLAPKPYRGKRNEPSYVAIVAERVAELMEKEVEEVANITTANAVQLFKPTK